jgi:hypothetical protein
MLRAVDDPGDACQTQLTVQCSKKDRDLVLGCAAGESQAASQHPSACTGIRMHEFR